MQKYSISQKHKTNPSVETPPFPRKKEEKKEKE